MTTNVPCHRYSVTVWDNGTELTTGVFCSYLDAVFYAVSMRDRFGFECDVEGEEGEPPMVTFV